MNSPCKGCDERSAGCHSLCEQYKDFAEECEKARELKRQHNIIEGYFISSMSRKKEYIRKRARK